MKLYIAVDTEGEACITRESSATAAYGTFQADYLRTVATREAAAAVEGAREAGADDIVVHDSGFIRGVTPIGMVLRYDELPRGIRIAMGRAFMKAVAAEGFDAAFLLGHHAMADTPGGVMAHTFSPVTIKGMALNGRPIGEIGVEALQLGALGIPVVLVTADEAGCREARDLLGDIELAPVKRGLGLHAAVSMHPDDACDLIRRKAKTRGGAAWRNRLRSAWTARSSCWWSATPGIRRARGRRSSAANRWERPAAWCVPIRRSTSGSARLLGPVYGWTRMSSSSR